LFTPAIVCSSTKDGMAAVAAARSIEAGRDRNINATPTTAPNTIAETIMRFMVILRRLRAITWSVNPAEGSKSQRLMQGSPSLTQDASISEHPV
jgi:hypothetical protein